MKSLPQVRSVLWFWCPEASGKEQETRQREAAQEQKEHSLKEAMSEEDAQRILNALNEKEKEIQEKRRVRMARRRVRVMDW